MRMDALSEETIAENLAEFLETLPAAIGVETFEDAGIESDSKGLNIKMILADGRHVDINLTIEAWDVTEDLGIDAKDYSMEWAS